jgi:hypothetical protein
VDFGAGRISWVSARDGFIRSIKSDASLLASIVGERASGLTQTMTVLRDSLYAIKSFHPAGDDPFQWVNEFHIVNLADRSTLRLGRLESPPRKQVKHVQLGTTRASMWPHGDTDPMHVVDRARQRICAGVGQVAEINCINASGERMSIRWAYDTVQFSADDRRRAEETTVNLSQGSGLTRQDIERAMAELPATYTPYSVLQIDTEGNLWISESMRDESGEVVPRFRIVNPDGRVIAFANHFRVMPVGLMDNLEIGATSLLTAVVSPEGVPMVGVYRIRK